MLQDSSPHHHRVTHYLGGLLYLVIIFGMAGWFYIQTKYYQAAIPAEYLTEDEALETIVNMGLESRIVADHTGVIKLCSPTAAQICGYTPAELLGKHSSIIVPDDMKSKHMNALSKAFDGGADILHKVNVVRCNVLKKDGTSRPVEVITRIINDHDDKVYAVVTLTPIERIEIIEPSPRQNPDN